MLRRKGSYKPGVLDSGSVSCGFLTRNQVSEDEGGCIVAGCLSGQCAGDRGALPALPTRSRGCSGEGVLTQLSILNHVFEDNTCLLPGR